MKSFVIIYKTLGPISTPTSIEEDDPFTPLGDLDGFDRPYIYRLVNFGSKTSPN